MFKFIDKKIINTFKGTLLLFALLFSLSVEAGEVTLYPRPMVSLHSTGDTFILEARLNPEGQCVNVAKVDLVYPPRVLEAIDFTDAGSAITLWVQLAVINDELGRISFSGGIPGGYCGEESILLGSTIFRVRNIEDPVEARIRFSAASRIFLSDGIGTDADLVRREASVVIAPDMPRPLIDLWQSRVSQDLSLPDITNFDIRRDPHLFSGRYFLIVTAADEISGVSHYEVAERRVLGFLPVERAQWRRIDPPYVLEDQSLRSMVSVKVVDKAGNEKVKTVRPTVGWQDVLPWILALIFIGFVWWKNKPQEEDDDRSRGEAVAEHQKEKPEFDNEEERKAPRVD